MKKVVRVAGHRIEHELGAPNPYYKQVKRQQPDGSVSVERIKRDIPSGVSPHDTKVLKAVRTRAWQLDMLFGFLGFNLGWTAVVGLVPLVGPWINVYFAVQTVRLAMSVEGGLNNWTLAQMLGNVAVDFLLTFVPILGSSLNAIFKCNARNAVILDHQLRRRG